MLMSGCGRKHRAKHLTRQFLNASAWAGPLEGERLGVCMEAPHGQHVRLLVLPAYHEQPTRVNEASVSVQNDLVPSENLTASGARTEEETKTIDESMLVSDSEPVEKLVVLPRKFHKVIWLGVKDVVVVKADVLEMKPSPDQMKSFTKSSGYELYRDALEKAKAAIDANRSAPRKTSYAMKESQISPSQAVGTTVSRLPLEPSGATVGEDLDDSGSENDWLSKGNPNRKTIKHRRQYFFGVEEEEDDEDEEQE